MERPLADRNVKADSSLTSIPVLDHVPSYVEFLNNHLLSNVPCLLPASVASSWPSIAAWSTTDLISGTTSGQDWTTPTVNWSRLVEDYGDHVVPTLYQNDEARQRREEETVSHAVTERIGKGQKPVYLKDWHLVRLAKDDWKARIFRLDEQGEDEGKREEEARRKTPYIVPDVFRDDWLNNLPTSSTEAYGDAAQGPEKPEEEGEREENDSDDDDFRFCYAGTSSSSSSTGIHRDVYTSYSWSTNVVGVKRWRLWPPTHAHCLRRFPSVRTSEIVSNYEAILSLLASSRPFSSSDQPSIEWSRLQEAMKATQTVIQRPGETIFVPSNWYHQVENITDCISLNHNWCNSVNLPSLYCSMVEEVEDVQASLSDVKEMLSDPPQQQQQQHQRERQEWQREWTKIVQDVAKQDAGWAWLGFWKMVASNLERPSAEAGQRPEQHWVRDRVRPLVVDFETRDEFIWLEEECRMWWRKARDLVQESGREAI